MTTLTKTNETTVIAPLAEAEMAALEQQIRTDIKAFQRVGLALIRIRDGRGYRLRGFKTFEAYCERVWDFTDRHGRRLIAAAETAEKVKAAVGVEPSSESVARVLAPVANDPIVLQRVAEKLQMKQATIANASAEKVAEVVAAVTGKPRPAKKDDKPRHTRPATNGKPAPAPAPAVGADDATTLQAILTSARSFLANHPWLADDDAARRLVGQLDQALIVAGNLLKAAYSRAGTPPAGKPGTKEPAGPPRCPSCKQPVKPGEPWCDNCGAAL